MQNSGKNRRNLAIKVRKTIPDLPIGLLQSERSNGDRLRVMRPIRIKIVQGSHCYS